MGSSVSRASTYSNRPARATHLSSRLDFCLLGDPLPRRPADAGPRCGHRRRQMRDKRQAKRSICEPSNSQTPPRYSSSQLSAAAVGAAAVCLSAPPTPQPVSLSHSHTQAPLCFRPLRACSTPCPTPVLASLRAQDMEDAPLMSPLTLDYVTSTGLAATLRHTNSHTSHHHHRAMS